MKNECLPLGGGIKSQVTGVSTPKSYAKQTLLTLGTITLPKGTWLVYYSGWVPWASNGIPPFRLDVGEYTVINNTQGNIREYSFTHIVTVNSETTLNINYYGYNDASTSGQTTGIAVKALQLI